MWFTAQTVLQTLGRSFFFLASGVDQCCDHTLLCLCVCVCSVHSAGPRPVSDPRCVSDTHMPHITPGVLSVSHNDWCIFMHMLFTYVYMRCRPLASLKQRQGFNEHLKSSEISGVIYQRCNRLNNILMIFFGF